MRSNQTDLQLSITTAITITKDVPPDLPALRVVQRPTAGPGVSLCAVGDIGLSGRAAITAGRGADKIFAEVAPLLRAADITFGNLESPLAGEIAPGKIFAAPITGAATLCKAGFNLLHLANNHVGDYGQTGLAVTIDAVCKAGMTPLGVGENRAAARQLVRTNMNGLRIGWLGSGRTLLPQHEVGPCYWEFDKEELLAAVRCARQTVDVLIISIHIGLMYLDYPRPEIKEMAEGLMAAGADLILMHHAHVLQGIQVTSQGQVCCYNLGNFLLDWREGNVEIPIMREEQNEGAVFMFHLDTKGVALAAALPTYITDDCQVRWAVGEHGNKILARLERISRDLEHDFTSAFERQRAERNTSAILKVLWFHARRGNWAYLARSLCKTRPEHLKMAVRWLARTLRVPCGPKCDGQ